MGRTIRRSPLDPDGSHPSRPNSPSKAVSNKNGDRRSAAVPKHCGRLGRPFFMVSLSRIDLLRIIFAGVLGILLVGEEVGQRAGFTLLLH